MTVQNDFAAWWQGIAALPVSRNEQGYFALRRIWADQTINTRGGARSFYRWGTEDYLTPALWQNWSIFEDADALASFLRTAGAPVGRVKRARWAYACEELTGIGRSFVTPDIMVKYEDEAGIGLLAIEAKRARKAAKLEDARKLEQYRALPSARDIARRHGCFLVSEAVTAATRRNTGDRFPIVSWETLATSQIAAAHLLPIDIRARKLTADWIARAFARQGVGRSVSAPDPQGSRYGRPDSYEAIRTLGLPDRVGLFIMGSESVEGSLRGEMPAPPLPWLADEPTVADISRPMFQSTSDRRVCRWRFEWNERKEISRAR